MAEYRVKHGKRQYRIVGHPVFGGFAVQYTDAWYDSWHWIMGNDRNHVVPHPDGGLDFCCQSYGSVHEAESGIESHCSISVDRK